MLRTQACLAALLFSGALLLSLVPRHANASVAGTAFVCTSGRTHGTAMDPAKWLSHCPSGRYAPPGPADIVAAKIGYTRNAWMRFDTLGSRDRVWNGSAWVAPPAAAASAPTTTSTAAPVATKASVAATATATAAATVPAPVTTTSAQMFVCWSGRSDGTAMDPTRWLTDCASGGYGVPSGAQVVAAKVDGRNVWTRFDKLGSSAYVWDGKVWTTVGSLARAPLTLSGTAPGGVVAGSPYSFTPTRAGTAEGPVAYSISNKPSWATFSTATGTLSGTPGASAVGAYTSIVVTATDGRTSAALPPFSITVSSLASAAASAPLRINWSTPVRNTDGSPLTDLAGFHVYTGRSLDSLAAVARLGAASTYWALSSLGAGTWHIGVAAINHAGEESDITAVMVNLR